MSESIEPPSDSLGDRVRAAHAVEREAVGMLDYLYEIPRSAWHMLDGHDWHDIDATRIGCRCGLIVKHGPR